MLYYKKSEVLFYKLDEVNKTYVEVFNNNTTQARLMDIKNENLYDQIVLKIQDYDFEICSQQEFEQFLSEAKSKF